MSIKQKKGISLIVLVITIIVMIILATAIILSLNGSGIIGKAHEAKTASDLANAKSVVALAKAEWDLNKDKLSGEYSSFIEYAEQKLKENSYTDEYIAKLEITEAGNVSIRIYTTYTDSNLDTAPIPVGFTVSTISTEQTIDTGLVILDEEGNEFVWVPVENIDLFKTTTSYTGTTITSPSYIEPLTETTNFVTDISLYADEIAQYYSMRDSVEEYKGFYIARYEAGLPEDETIATVKIDGTDKPVSKKGAKVWRSIPFDSKWEYDNANSTVKTSIEYGDDSNPGAALVAKKAYAKSTSVVSHLIYGIQWDAALRFIATTDSQYPTDSTGKGNYSGSQKEETGYYAVNNIYDMAGDVCEWTYEVCPLYRMGYRAKRGGGYWDTDPNASSRSYDSPDGDHFLNGFRVVLYVKM